MRVRLSIAALIIIAIFLSSIPYIYGYATTPPGHQFTGLTYNIDDGCVYLSWMRQAADGHVFIRNQFAIEPQQRLQFNIFFLALGWIAGLLQIPLIVVYHSARILLIAGLLLTVYWFGRFFFKKDEHRFALILVIAFSSGIGWLFGTPIGHSGTVDNWQPEAITFLSMYLNPLFLIAQILMLASFGFLLKSRSSGKASDAVLAGTFLLLLANIHTYDVAIVGAVWVVFLVIASLVKRAGLRTWALSALAAAIASPALLYQWYLYHTEQVFRMRANTATPSPELWNYIAGFGLIFVLAAIGLALALRRRGDLLLPAVWGVIGFALPYIPIAQQRKLVMGLHIALAILATLALIRLCEKRGWSLRLAALVLVALTIPSNMMFMRRDVALLNVNETATLIHRPYLANDELLAMQWLRANTNRSETVLAFPDAACFIPVLAGNRTYVGHWSETPDFGRKLNEWRKFAEAETPDTVRLDILKRSKTKYVWWDNSIKMIPSRLAEEPSRSALDPSRKPYLKRVFTIGRVNIYQTYRMATPRDTN
ncbi:MAG: hypothetical protein Q7N50_13120 [Armatimonadota bacterium]|nr:hypothetical protein [Armatimonadota bacterium]